MPSEDTDLLHLDIAQVPNVTGEDLKGDVWINFEVLKSSPVEAVDVILDGKLSVYAYAYGLPSMK